MPSYVHRGSIPAKRHTQHRIDGKLTYEELVSREGFSDIYANVYHVRPPTRIRKVGAMESRRVQPAVDNTSRHRHIETFKFEPKGDWISGRREIAYNDDCSLSVAIPTDFGGCFYRNSAADEVVFVHDGEGTVHSQLGDLAYRPGDYIIIPRGILFRLEMKPKVEQRFLVIETHGPLETPSRYRNRHGQLLEHSPFCERDFRLPEFVPPRDEEGEFPLKVKLPRGIQNYMLAHHPFDLVGWDGYYYPWIFNINDFMPIVGKIHQPPPVHQTFQAPGLVICSFCPRLFDFHPEAIPAPYAHSNVESEEVLYYVEGDFMSRKGVSRGSITFHPPGIPHGPHPGRYEGSIGKKETLELAVMMDTFRPLNPTRTAEEVEDENYPTSWLE